MNRAAAESRFWSLIPHDDYSDVIQSLLSYLTDEQVAEIVAGYEGEPEPEEEWE